MDEWIKFDRIEKVPSEANEVMKERKKSLENSSMLPSDTGEPAIKRARLESEDNDPPLVLSAETQEAPEALLDPLVTSDNESGEGNGLGVTTILDNDHDEHEGMDELQLLEHEEITKVKNISKVIFGEHDIECWYYSPFPKEYYPHGVVEYLYFCEFSLRFFKTKGELRRYQQKPSLLRHPPGNEIYRDDEVSMFEVDGAVERIYCQNLSYFAKLFLDHKTLYFDVDPFLFYVLCTRDGRGFHPVGYFSKEKSVVGALCLLCGIDVVMMRCLES